MESAAHVYGHYKSTAPAHTHSYLWPKVIEILRRKTQERRGEERTLRVLDAGCGNGAFCRHLAEGFPNLQLSGIDLEESGIQKAQREIPQCRFLVHSVYDDLVEPLGSKFDIIVSLEVVEHLLTPRRFVDRVQGALKENGTLVISTPFHGYWKNLALAVSGKMDRHFTALWEGGHVKFWSRKTLTQLLTNAGFVVEEFHGVGRIPWFWKSMILVATARKSSATP